eukprot:2782172-Prymnesium_polylepis.1
MPHWRCRTGDGPPLPPVPLPRDNTSALAALTKGYSGLPDSARLVHVCHAWAAATARAAF